jgi:hypothetical protein
VLTSYCICKTQYLKNKGKIALLTTNYRKP